MNANLPISDTKDLIFILGMHRSGTSALTRMVNLLGVRLGEALIEAQTGVNDRGFWENREMVALNEAILRRLDSTWFDYAEYPREWWLDARFDELKGRIVGWLEDNFGAGGMAALKDPRLCRLLPIWRHAAEQAGFNCKAILVIRAPHEVRQSLLRRDPFSPRTCDLLWLRYLVDGERFSHDMPRAIVDYHQLLDDWRKVAADLSDCLSLQWPAPPEEAAQGITQEIDPALRRQTEAQPEMGSPLSPALDAVYQHMRESMPGVPDEAKVKQQLALLMEHASCAPAALEDNRRLAAKAIALQQSGEELTYAQEVIRQKDQGIAELDQRLHSLGKDHAETLKTVTERDEQLAVRNLEFEQLEQDLRKSGEWAKKMEAEARKNWRTYEETAATLNRIHDHPVAGRLCRLLKLHEQS